MTEQKAYQILGLEEGVSFDDISHARRVLLKKYHQDSKEADREKFDDVGKAYKFLKKIYEEKKDEENKQVDKRPPRNKDPEFTTPRNTDNSSKKGNSSEKEKSTKDKQKDQSGFKKFINGTTKNEKAYDELDAFIKAQEKELEKKNIKVRPKYNQELLNISNRGVAKAKEYKKEEERLKKEFQNIINSANEFDKLQEERDKSIKKLLEWGLKPIHTFLKESQIDVKYRGYTNAAEFIRIRHIVEKETLKIEKSIGELEKLLDFIDKEKIKLKGIAPDVDFDELKKQLEADKGNINVEEIREQAALLSEMVKEKEKIVNDFKTYFLEVEQRINSLYNASLDTFIEYYLGDNTYQYTEEELNEVRKQIAEYESVLPKNSRACNEFITYYTNLGENDKKLFQEIININDILKEENKAQYSKEFFEELKEKVEVLKKEKLKEEDYLKAREEFNILFDQLEEKLEKEYGVNLNLWKKYRKEKCSIEMLERVKNDILDYEKDISLKASAYDDFIAFYERFTEEEKALFGSKIDLDDYLAKDKRLAHSKKDYAKIKEQILEIKEEKELKEKIERDRNAKREFIIFYNEKYQLLKKEFGVDLEKWAIYSSEENSFFEEDYLRAKQEILALEDELKTKKNVFLAETIGKKSNQGFEEIISEEVKKSVERFKKEQANKEAYLKAYQEFISYFDAKENELKKLYGVSLDKWSKYRLNANYTIVELKEVYKEITKFEHVIKENARAYDEFISYYNNLNDEDKELYTIFNVDKYLSKDNRILYPKDVYDKLKNKVLEYKKEKELQENQKRYRKIKKDFLAFFNAKEALFKKLYNTNLYKWRPYGKEENDYTEAEYFSVSEEITAYEDEKENERMNALKLIKNALNILGINITTYLEEKRKNIKTISVNDIARYQELLFNISYIVSKIKNLNGGEEKLKAYLKEQNKQILEIPAIDLEELYKKICIETEKEKLKNNKQDKENSYNHFKEYYQSEFYKFRNLYGRNIPSFEYLLEEENKDKFTKDDYENAIKYIKDIGEKLEEERMSLAYNLQVDLKDLGLDVKDYLEVRGKDYLSVSIRELEEYNRLISLLNEIYQDEDAKIVLIDYLEINNVRLINLDDDVILTIYADLENKLKNEQSREEYKPNM